MPRPLRPTGSGLIFHAVNRGNNRQKVFFNAQDRQHFLDALAVTQQRYPFRLYGFCLMTDHFHLLLEPLPGESISRILQSLTVAHTWRYHRRRGGEGHVWQGRFKSPIVQADEHVLAVLRYIEANPLRARIVKRLEDYPADGSSFAYHAQGTEQALLAPAPGWLTLGPSAKARASVWRRLCHRSMAEADLKQIRASVKSGRPFGDQRFVARMAARLGLDLTPRKRGRPREKK